MRASTSSVKELSKCRPAPHTRSTPSTGTVMVKECRCAGRYCLTKQQVPTRRCFRWSGAALVQQYGSVGVMKTFITDFELAAIKAIQSVFPEVVVRGCSFHLRQALMRRIQHEGLQSVYDEDTQYMGWCTGSTRNNTCRLCSQLSH